MVLMILWNILQQTSLWDMYSRYFYTWRSENTLKGVQRPHAVSTQWGHMDVCITVWTGCPSNSCWHNMSYQKMTNIEISIILAERDIQSLDILWHLMKYVMIMFCKLSLYISLLKWHFKVVHVSRVKLMACHILIDKPNQVHKHNHQ